MKINPTPISFRRISVAVTDYISSVCVRLGLYVAIFFRQVSADNSAKKEQITLKRMGLCPCTPLLFFLHASYAENVQMRKMYDDFC